jgi:hypothetical protein
VQWNSQTALLTVITNSVHRIALLLTALLHRLPPGGAGSWLYVLHGSKVLLLLPSQILPTVIQSSRDTSHNTYCCVQDCYTDFRLAPGGAASWLYVLHGSKVLLLLPPTQRNRRLFLTWSAVTRAAQGKENLVAECFLADYAEGAVRVEVRCCSDCVVAEGLLVRLCGFAHLPLLCMNAAVSDVVSRHACCSGQGELGRGVLPG